MKTWIVRFASLYVFNVAVLFLIGFITPRLQVGWGALWGAIILTAATIWVKPLVTKAVNAGVARTSPDFRRGREKIIGYVAIYVVAFVCWVLVLMLSRINASSAGPFFGLILPPLLLLVAWIIYDLVDDKIEKTAGDVYDRAAGAFDGNKQAPAAPAPESAATKAGRDELKDGLTPEQRKMMNDL